MWLRADHFQFTYFIQYHHVTGAISPNSTIAKHYSMLSHLSIRPVWTVCDRHFWLQPAPL